MTSLQAGSTTTNELIDLLDHHDELARRTQALRRQMLPLVTASYPDVAAALELMFGSDINTRGNRREPA